MTLVELLAELTGAEIELRREGSVLVMAVVKSSAGRRIMALERTYREGIVVLLDPTEDEMETARSGNLWDLWNSERAQDLSSAV